MLTAITRDVSPSIGDCQLTHQPRCPIDVPRAKVQHAAYEEALRRLGCQVRRLPPEPHLPDAVFVEDTCIVLDELAVLARPGAPSRRPETVSMAEALEPLRPLRRIEPPATLDGGDVLVHEKTVYVGLTSRTNADAVDQLRLILGPFGYRVQPIEVCGCLHLKSAACLVAPDTLLVNRSWLDAACLPQISVIDVDPSEPPAANALLIGGVVLYSSAFPQTRKRLEGARIEVLPVDLSELHKAEGGVTCCSVICRSRHDEK